MRRVEALVGRLRASGWLTRDSVTATPHEVPQHLIAPAVAWTGDGDQVRQHPDPEGWLDLVPGDDAIITRLDDGAADLATPEGRFTSSLSASTTVVSQLEVLDALGPSRQ
jgi:hypothetical protein